MPLAVVRPVRISRDDADLHTRVRRTVGFRAFVGDEPIAPTRRSYDEARSDAWRHNHPSGWVIPPSDLPAADDGGTLPA